MTKMEVKKRPELIQLPTVPTILKISEIPSETYVMKISFPFTLTHLAKAGINKAFVISETTKSVRTVLGEEVGLLREMQKKINEVVTDRYPLLKKHVHLDSGLKVHFGRAQANDYYYCADIPKLIKNLDDCGFSKMPLRAFMIPIENPPIWVHFTRKKMVEGFVASQFGNKMYDSLSVDELEELIRLNPILQSLKAYICQTAVATGKWMTCRVASKEASE